MKSYIFNNKQRATYILPTIFYLLLLAGCSTAPYVKPPLALAPSGMRGTYHQVEKGQTLWKISKMYAVDLDDLARVNRIVDTTAVETGQQLFIPDRARPQLQVVKYSDNDDFIWPLRGRITGSFGQTINNILNKGINIQPSVSLNVVASRSGRVVFSSDNFAGFGKTVIIDHGDGLFTVYARNSSLFVKPGENVQKGSAIARAGSSGRNRDTYLHFEVRRGPNPQNPLFYLP